VDLGFEGLDFGLILGLPLGEHFIDIKEVFSQLIDLDFLVSELLIDFLELSLDEGQLIVGVQRLCQFTLVLFAIKVFLSLVNNGVINL
jgi:hypothetical protein